LSQWQLDHEEKKKHLKEKEKEGTLNTEKEKRERTPYRSQGRRKKGGKKARLLPLKGEGTAALPSVDRKKTKMKGKRKKDRGSADQCASCRKAERKEKKKDKSSHPLFGCRFPPRGGKKTARKKAWTFFLTPSRKGKGRDETWPALEGR